MATSTQRAVSDGTLVLLDVSIEYLDRSEISVYYNNVPATTWAWVGTTEKRISFSPAVPLGVEVLVKRTTDLTKLRHEYTKGAAFTAGTLDEDLTQVLHIAQEATEGGLGGDFFNDIDMHGHVVKNASPASLNTDLATLGQVISVTSSQVAAAQAAKAAAEAVYDSFDDRYLGIKTSPPLLDNDGNVIAAGALYFNGTNNTMYVRTTSNTWTAAYVPAGAASTISFAPAGSIAATNVQAAIVELDNEKLSNTPTLSALASVLMLIYPVGSLYFNAASSINPATILGFGTWVAYATGKALVGIDVTNPLMDTLGETFGQADTILPAHNHGGTTANTDLSGQFGTNQGLANGSFSISSSYSGAGQNAQPCYVIQLNGNHNHGIPTDGISATDKNYQPSIAVHIWVRTA